MGLTMGHFGLKHTRDRLAGDRIGLTRRREQLLAQIDVLQSRVAALDAELDEKAEQIRAINAALNAVFDDDSPAESRQTFPKKHLTQWGGLTRGALAVLREARGEIRTTAEIANALAMQAGIDLPSRQDGKGFRRAVRQRLSYLAKKGCIERLHDPLDNKEGLWRLKVSPE